MFPFLYIYLIIIIILQALCCVDKKGILSWPNPTAEKVFFLKSPKSKSISEESTQICEDSGEASEELHDIHCLNEDVLEIKRLSKVNKRLDVKDHSKEVCLFFFHSCRAEKFILFIPV